MLAFASASCALLALGPARRNLHRGDASLSTRAPGTHPRSPSPALLSATRSSPASCRGSLAPVQPNGLEASAENRVYSAQATEEPLARLRLGSRWRRSKWMRKDVSSVSAEQSSQGKRKPGDRGVQCGWMRAPRSRCLPRPERTSTSHFAMEAVISFLQTYGRPHQITFDRDPTLGGKRVGPGFSLTAASAPAVLRDYTLCLSATSPRQACLR